MSTTFVHMLDPCRVSADRAEFAFMFCGIRKKSFDDSFVTALAHTGIVYLLGTINSKPFIFNSPSSDTIRGKTELIVGAVVKKWACLKKLDLITQRGRSKKR